MTRVFMALGLLAGIGGCVWLGLTIASVRASVSARGEVIRIDRDVGDTGAIYWPTFRFTDAKGQTVERRFSVGVGDEKRFTVGDGVDVLYRADDPRFVRVNDPVQLYLKPALPIIAGLIACYLARGAQKASARAKNG